MARGKYLQVRVSQEETDQVDLLVKKYYRTDRSDLLRYLVVKELEILERETGQVKESDLVEIN